MALEDIPLRQVTGTYLRPDGIKAAKGTVRFRPSSVLAVASDDLFVVPDPSVSVRLDYQGKFTVTLPVTVDPDWIPQGWVWVVQQTISGKTLPDGFLTLSPGAGAVDLSDAMVFETQTATYPPGAFLPPGGTAGQVLTKQTSSDYAAGWSDSVGGGGGGGGTGDVTQAQLAAAVAPKADKTYVDAADAARTIVIGPASVLPTAPEGALVFRRLV